jgi:DNA-binding PadR family transcriptional regulator
MKIEITILGLLSEENLYGYEIKKKIMDRLEDYVDIKFGSIYYAIKKSVENGWVKRVGIEKESGNPERYIYEILPAGKKYYKKLIKQYLEKNFIHFDIDIVLMFYRTFSPEIKEQFIEDRFLEIKKRIVEIEKKMKEDESNFALLTYLLSHLKAELAWLGIMREE